MWRLGRTLRFNGAPSGEDEIGGLSLALAQAGLALAYGLTLFLLAAAIVTNPRVVGHTRHVQTVFYVVAFGVLLPVAVVVARSRRNPASLAALNLAAVSVVLLVAHLIGAIGSYSELRIALLVGAATIALANLGAYFVHLELPFRTRWVKRIGAIVLGALLLGTLVLFIPPSAFAWNRHHASLAIAVVFALLLAFTWRIPRRFTYLIDLAAIVLILILSSDFNDYGQTHALDQDFYLGPVNAILHGHTMLVNTFAQYGVGVMYFLAAVFKIIPIGYGGLQVVNDVLRYVEFALIYVVLRIGCRRQAYAVVGLLVCLAANILSGIGPTIEYASVGPLRFGLPWLLVLLAILRARLPARRRLLGVPMLGVVAVSAVWSFETFVYTIGTALALSLFDSALERGSRRERIKTGVRRCATVVLVAVAAQALFAIGTRLSAGEWPDLGVYLAFIKIYGWHGFGGFYIPVHAWSLGYLIAAFYFVSLAAVAFILLGRREFVAEERVALTAIWGSSVFGVIAYSYFAGRAHPNNLHHIGPPAIVLAALWTGLLARRLPRKAILLRVVLFACMGWAAAALIGEIPHPSAAFNGISPIVNHRLSVHLGRIGALVDEKPDDPEEIDGETLLNDFALGKAEVPVVLSAQEQTGVLMRAGRANAFSIDDPNQDALIPVQTLRLVAAEIRKLRPGSFVLTTFQYLSAKRTPLAPSAGGYVFDAPNGLDLAVLSNILARFSYKIVGTGSWSLVMIKLGAKRS